MPNPLTWRRLGSGTAALFLVIGAFLAGRVRGGTDPALGKTTTQQTTTTSSSTASSNQVQPDPNPMTTQAS